MKQRIKLIGILSLVTLFSCRREKLPESLPAVTQTGQNTLGFLLDGKLWTNYGRRCLGFMGGCKDNKVKAEFYKQPNGDFVLSVDAAYSPTSQTIDQSFSFNTTKITSTGTYALDSSDRHQVVYVASHYTETYKDYRNRLPGKFILTITRFDTTNKIIAGTFSGILYNRPNLSDSVQITDGRFDSQLDYIK